MPVDNKINGNIIDDDINAILVQSLPQGARLTGLVDACHSGSCMDLPYVYSLSSSTMTYNKSKYAPTQGVLVQQGSLNKSSNGDVVLFSSCQDAQTSSDLTIKYASGATTSGGAMTSGFMKAIKENPGASYAKILDAMRSNLAEYAQVCQLSSARPMDMSSSQFAL
jgi:hypothetical protein